MNNLEEKNKGLRLERLTLYQFKNYESLEITFDKSVVCFLGNNGEGKTNLLDAIHYLSFSKSYFNTIDGQNIRQGEEQASVSGEFERQGQPEMIHCAIRKSQRKIFKRNHKEYERLSEHIGLFPSVMITPYDIELILEGSEVRRKFIDATISQYSAAYLENLMQYNQALQQRNNLLKTMNRSGSFSSELLEPWDHRLSMHADIINRERAAFIEAFSPVFLEVYHHISGGKEEVKISLQAEHADAPLIDKLAQCRERDRVLERTTVGPHKDDLDFLLNGRSLKKFASQGQQKSFLIALKLAQYLILKKNTQLVPILLLDDLYDKVDETRVLNLLQWLIEHHPGQVFITDTHVDRIPALLQRLNAGYNAFIISQNSYSTTEVAHEF